MADRYDRIAFWRPWRLDRYMVSATRDEPHVLACADRTIRALYF